MLTPESIEKARERISHAREQATERVRQGAETIREHMERMDGRTGLFWILLLLVAILLGRRRHREE